MQKLPAYRQAYKITAQLGRPSLWFSLCPHKARAPQCTLCKVQPHKVEALSNAATLTHMLLTCAATRTKTAHMPCPPSLRRRKHCHGCPCQIWRLPWMCRATLASTWLPCTQDAHLTFGNGEPSRQQHQEEDSSTQGVGDNHVPAAGSNQTEDCD